MEFLKSISPFMCCFYQNALQAAVVAEASRKRNEDIAAGRVAMNGRELFEREPWVFDDA